MIPATITTDVLEHADGRPIAYVDATTVAVFAYQEPDGTYVIDIRTRDEIPPGGLRLLVDGDVVNSAAGMPQGRANGRCPALDGAPAASPQHEGHIPADGAVWQYQAGMA